MSADDSKSARLSVVILSTADYDSAVWTNKQHLANGIAANGLNVFYIESLGLRQPSFSRRDFGRIVNKIRRRTKGPNSISLRPEPPQKLRIITPRILPFHRFSGVRAINKFLMAWTVNRELPAPKDYILWTFSPYTYGLETGCVHTVYHSVDLLHTLPGVPVSSTLAAEVKLLAKAGTVIASSSGVAQHLSRLSGIAVKLWENVAETGVFASAAPAVRLPRVIFAGNLTATKVDVSLLEGIVAAGVPLAIAGPIGVDGTSGKAFTKLLAHSQVTYLGNLSLPELADEVGKSVVGVIPYFVNGYTQGVFPMKVFEYLSAGLHVVSTDIASLVNKEGIVGLTVTPADTFVATVLSAVSEFTDSAAAQRRDGARDHSWRSRNKEVLRLIEDVSLRNSESM